MLLPRQPFLFIELDFSTKNHVFVSCFPSFLFLNFHVSAQNHSIFYEYFNVLSILFIEHHSNPSHFTSIVKTVAFEKMFNPSDWVLKKKLNKIKLKTFYQTTPQGLAINCVTFDTSKYTIFVRVSVIIQKKVRQIY